MNFRSAATALAATLVVGLASAQTPLPTPATPAPAAAAPATVATPFTASFNYSARDAKGAESVAPATVSVAVSPAALIDDIQVSSATVQIRSGNRFTWDLSGTTSIATGNSINVSVATTNGPLNLGAATLTAATTGARWRVSVTTTGYGPATPATATVKSKLGQSVTVPISYK